MDNNTLTEADITLLERCRHYELDAKKLDRMAEICERQHQKIRELKEVVAEQGRKITRTETELRDALGRLEAEATLRPSLEVLQRMANGLDPFDRGRFQCAVEALAYERPKLTANISAGLQLSGIGNRLDALTKAQERGLRLVGPDGPDAA